MYKRPYSSPWGKIQHIKKKMQGVYEVSTASHGGIMVCTEAAAQLLSPAAIEHGNLRNGFYCFEEDCDACIVIRELLDKNLWKIPKHYLGREAEYNETVSASLLRWNTDYLVAMGDKINITHKGQAIERIVKTPVPRIEEGQEARAVLLNFFRDLGWNPSTHSLDSCKVRTSPVVFNNIKDTIIETAAPEPIDISAFMTSKGPSGSHEDIKDGIVVLLKGWLIPNNGEGVA